MKPYDLIANALDVLTSVPLQEVRAGKRGAMIGRHVATGGVCVNTGTISKAIRTAFSGSVPGSRAIRK